MRSTISLFFLLVSSLVICAQDVALENASFEGMPRHSKPPKGWQDFGFPNESPIDVQPSHAFQVSQLAFEGNTYVGMVVRDNATWESVMGTLDGVLKKGQCYRFSVALSRSDTYLATSRLSKQPANYNVPCFLQIWAVDAEQKTKELLAKSPLIDHTDWQRYSFDTKIQLADAKHILLELAYDEAQPNCYNGNMLIDAFSSFVAIDSCAADPLLSERMLDHNDNKGLKQPASTYAPPVSRKKKATVASPKPVPYTYAPSKETIEQEAKMLFDKYTQQVFASAWSDNALKDLADFTVDADIRAWTIVFEAADDDVKAFKKQIKGLGLNKEIYVMNASKLKAGYKLLSQAPFMNGTISLYY